MKRQWLDVMIVILIAVKKGTGYSYKVYPGVLDLRQIRLVQALGRGRYV